MRRWPMLIVALLLAGCASTPSASGTPDERPAPSVAPSPNVPSATVAGATPEPAGETDGMIAYVAGADAQIHLLDLATGESRQLTHLTEADATLTSRGPMRPALSCFFGPQWLSWSPNGSLLAFAYGGCDSVIHVTDLEGRVTRIADGRSPAWSPDGRRLLFSANAPYCPAADWTLCGDPPQPGSWNLQVVDVATETDPHSLSLDAATVFGSGPSYSPDGSLVAYQGRLPDPARDPELFGAAYVVGADGTHARLVARGAWPTGWLPDGRLLLVDERTTEVRALDLATADAMPIGRTSSVALVSPSGQHLMTTKDDIATGATTTVVVAVADGSTVAEVAGYPWGWAPDGSAAAVVDLESGMVLVIGHDGGELGRHQLPDPMNAFTGAWRPGS